MEQCLQALEAVRAVLDPYARLPEEYTLALRQHALVQSVHYSTRIEGNTLTLAQVESLLSGQRIRAPEDQVQEAINYREALSYIQRWSARAFTISDDVLHTIHYLVTKSLPGAYGPGQYRTEQNYVVDRLTGRRVFLPPPPENVPELMGEFVQWLNRDDTLPATYKAGLAHLNLVAIHPFLDGNGRTARVLDALVMYRGGFRSQYLVSLEAHFGRDTQGYYRALSASLGPHYAPPQDVTPWMEYYSVAHLQEAEAAVTYTRELVAELDGLAEALKAEGLSRWQLAILFSACRTGHISNRIYRFITKRSHQSAVADFAKLIAKGLLVRAGRGRSVGYLPSERTQNTFQQIRSTLEH